MNRFKKIIQPTPTTASTNLQRNGDTTVKEHSFSFLDGRSLKRSTTQRSRQFNLRLQDQLLEQLYQWAAQNRQSLTSIVESALVAYFQQHKQG